ncbi:hypothetical protein SCP_0606760 [Sparassis crispa]|uniref:Uncharacterized protein n=1 Tax=Sparassis crispa TaxID=139825 RepID=A0A401GR41_9APHY|nr:hypothetical protein SCP_0606760 [Sparassis crispa]GBE84697.1 hypothetical protein SCP_0606760 [Sparassis crispa]
MRVTHPTTIHRRCLCSPELSSHKRIATSGIAVAHNVQLKHTLTAPKTPGVQVEET